jgi:hypothetical protein
MSALVPGLRTLPILTSLDIRCALNSFASAPLLERGIYEIRLMRMDHSRAVLYLQLQ